MLVQDPQQLVHFCTTYGLVIFWGSVPLHVSSLAGDQHLYEEKVMFFSRASRAKLVDFFLLLFTFFLEQLHLFLSLVPFCLLHSTFEESKLGTYYLFLVACLNV